MTIIIIIIIIHVTWSRLPVVTDAVDDIMRHFGVLRDGQHVVAGAGDRVPDQEHAMSLSLQKGNRFLTT